MTKNKLLMDASLYYPDLRTTKGCREGTLLMIPRPSVGSISFDYKGERAA